eukprot:CAMPEP_0204127876 /NCGR_PEP_ID=MMETSP0361-20130328/11850_1 /ASSEMBLY_ACC=CAM_ASM_000343 /TAXON_ID=268821 /ORGANISM="Scrippsiella Hangoei, Strain SHTV-5" /LENGTH=129 /DNA_ID=CAMNT_0051080001 /DNA_START=141 /DNA_END=528 /DNA_ORIENTATION=+
MSLADTSGEGPTNGVKAAFPHTDALPARKSEGLAERTPLRRSGAGAEPLPSPRPARITGGTPDAAPSRPPATGAADAPLEPPGSGSGSRGQRPGVTAAAAPPRIGELAGGVVPCRGPSAAAAAAELEDA